MNSRTEHNEEALDKFNTAMKNIKFTCKLCMQESAESPMQYIMEELLRDKFEKNIQSERLIGQITFKTGFCRQCKQFFENTLELIDKHVLIEMINEGFTSSKRNNLRRSISRWKNRNPKRLEELHREAMLEVL